jgi:diguanylate cyclase (GGDEF)-like protein
MEDFFQALVRAARRSSTEVLRELERAARAVAPQIDAVLFFEYHDGVLTCRYASGSRAEHFRSLRIRDEGSLPGLAVRTTCSRLWDSSMPPLVPGDRAAIAVPMISERRIRALWCASSATTPYLEQTTLSQIVACSSEPYLLAIEREADRNDATFDSLTGTLGPRAFRRHLHAVVAAAGRSVLSLWFVDTDNFKRVNDCYGHAAGDMVLQQMAVLLREHVSAASDAIGRRGGDEFCVLLRGSKKTAAIELAHAFCRAVWEHHFALSERVTASIGIATYPFDAGDASSLLEAADAAMYYAKRSGRNRVAYAVEGSGFALYE